MKALIVTFFGEVRKGLLISWTYRANTLVSLLTIGFVFLAIGFLIGDGQLDPARLSSMFMGYLTWFYALSAISDLSWGIRGEINAGTLEQMSMSTSPIGVVLLGRSFANLMITTVQILIQSLAMSWLVGIRLPMTWTGVLILAVTLIGVYGFGFMLAGATLVFKQVESFSNLFQNILMFMNGTLLPVALMPGWLAAISYTLPTTQGVVVLRRVVLNGQSLLAVWQDGNLLWLIVHSAIYFAAGWMIFVYCERVAKARGSLGQY
ncbi:MAG: ABC transporter permease [Anaerolineae bacterium]|nr:ABC transporter permease [Anaerolineae bacterium]